MFASRRWKSALAATLCVLFTCTTPAWAQKKVERLPPYDVQGLEQTRVWVPWVFAFIFGAGVILLGIKNPHRGHLD